MPDLTKKQFSEVMRFLKSEKKGWAGDRSEYASAYKRAIERTEQAMKAASSGSVYSAETDSWQQSGD